MSLMTRSHSATAFRWKYLLERDIVAAPDAQDALRSTRQALLDVMDRLSASMTGDARDKLMDERYRVWSKIY